ncbi:hypothetical protein CYMTET_55333 [Cymbomonas tetramitiformis]|uniref:Uncharacterized protein n=1 Tax=Cymbomonas tetramitiformis TaxID=36881 RepID=A0AAE0BDH5_9CHLO|nr:hypothetical protein CYMTET_55333 [Cymbomonas tetramitiformis]
MLFDAKTGADLLYSDAGARDDEIWKLDSGCQHFISQMLQANETFRPTVQKLLEDPWLTISDDAAEIQPCSSYC